MAHPVVHFEVSGNDQPKLRDFYSRLFDWKITYEPQMNYSMVDTQTPGAIGGGIGPAEGGQKVKFYVQVANLEDALAKAESLGGKTVMPPMRIPNVVALAQFSDPEGNVIGLVEDTTS